MYAGQDTIRKLITGQANALPVLKGLWLKKKGGHSNGKIEG